MEIRDPCERKRVNDNFCSQSSCICNDIQQEGSSLGLLQQILSISLMNKKNRTFIENIATDSTNKTKVVAI